jgi:hypothetical protein
MNTMGKILVIINLLFALVTGGFLAVDFATRSNWRQAYESLAEEMKVSRSNTDTLHATAALVAEKLKKAENRSQDLEKQLGRERLTHKKELEVARGDAIRAKDQSDKIDVTGMIKMGENERLRSENKALLKVIQERDQTIVKLNDDRNKAIDQVTQALNERNGALERSESLMERVRELEKWKAQNLVNASGPSTPGSVRNSNQPNPPPAYVHGKVEKVDPTDRYLLQINLGTDAGLAVNQTLDVFHLSPRPEYLGMLRIVDAGNHTAIGRLIPSRLGGGARSEVRPGDEVASSIQPPR